MLNTYEDNTKKYELLKGTSFNDVKPTLIKIFDYITYTANLSYTYSDKGYRIDVNLVSFDKFVEIFYKVFDLNDEYKSQKFVNFILDYDEIIIKHSAMDTEYLKHMHSYTTEYKILMQQYINNHLLKTFKVKTYTDELSTLEIQLSDKQTVLSVLEDNQIMANREFDRATNQGIKDIIIDKLTKINTALINCNQEIENIEGDIKSRVRSIEAANIDVDKATVDYATKLYNLQRLYNKIEKASLNIDVLFESKFTPLLYKQGIFITDILVVESFKRYLNYILINLIEILKIDTKLNINEGTIQHMISRLGFTELFAGFDSTKGSDIFAGKIKRSPTLKLSNLSFLAKLAKDIYTYQTVYISLERISSDPNVKLMNAIYYTLLLSQTMYRMLFGNFGFLINVNNHRGLSSRGIISSNETYKKLIPFVTKKSFTDDERKLIKDEYWKVVKYIYSNQAIIFKNKLGINSDFYVDINNLFEAIEHKLSKEQKLHLKINNKEP